MHKVRVICTSVVLMLLQRVLCITLPISSAMLCHVCQLTFRGQRESCEDANSSSFPYHLTRQLTSRGQRERHKTTESPPFPAYNHHQSSLGIKVAASQGCHLCTILWALLSVEERSNTIGHGQNPIDQSGLQRDHVQIKIVPTTLADDGRSSLQIAYPLESPIDNTWSGRFCVKFLELISADGAYNGL